MFWGAFFGVLVIIFAVVAVVLIDKFKDKR